MSLRRLLVPAALAAAALAAAGCRSGPDLGPDAEGRSIDLELVGGSFLSRGDALELVAENLRDLRRGGYRKAAVDDAAFVLEQALKDAGFAFAVVEYEFDASEPEVEVRFLVDEGPRVRLMDVVVERADAIDPEELGAVLAAVLGEPGEAWYSEAAVEDAASAIEVRYRDRGYQDAEVLVGETRFGPARRAAEARIVVREGEAYRLADVAAEGVDEEVAAALRDRWAPLVGEPYTPRLAARALGRVEQHFRERGRPDVDVELAEVERGEGGAVILRLEVYPGPLVRVGEVRFEGAEDTDESFLENRVLVEEGELYDASTVRESFERLYATGLFRVVRPRLVPGDAPSTLALDDAEVRDLVFEVEEFPSLELFVEPGYGSYEGPRLRAGLRERNLLGEGYVVRLEGLVSPKTRRVETGITDPWFLGTDVVADIGLELERREEPSFSFQEVAVATSLRKQWTDELSTGLGWRLSRSEILDQDVPDEELEDAPDDFDLSALSFSPLWDARDNPLSPTDGERAELRVELASGLFGSEVDFARGTLSVAAYADPWDGGVVAGHVRSGVVVPTEDTGAIPLQERFFNGGENSVRSFSESDLGPKDDDGDPIGGEAFHLLSLEVRQSLPRRFELAVFFDTGNVVLDHAEYLELDGFRHALGAGLRYLLPVGPLRVDVGWNPTATDAEDDFVVHVAIGRSY